MLSSYYYSGYRYEGYVKMQTENDGDWGGGERGQGTTNMERER